MLGSHDGGFAAHLEMSMCSYVYFLLFPSSLKLFIYFPKWFHMVLVNSFQEEKRKLLRVFIFHLTVTKCFNKSSLRRKGLLWLLI